MAKNLIGSNNKFDPSLERGIIKDAWEERKYLSSYQFSEYIPNLSNIKDIRKLKVKRELQQNITITKKINDALNNLFMSGGEPDVL